MSHKHTGVRSKVPSGADYDFYLPGMVPVTSEPGRIERFLSNLRRFEI